ncbi:MAG: histidine kinase [Bacteroidetes bacterium]|nr:histidine kinase [Bacteroidota bacterium]
MVKIRRYIFLLFFILPLCLVAQQFNFKHVGIEDELPSSECYNIIQDSKGYIWFSTNAGLCRYNGRDLKCFSVSNGLQDNTVFRIHEDKNGYIWFNTISSSVGYIYRDSVHKVEGSKQLQKYLKTGLYQVFSLENDTDGNLLIATNKGIYRLNVKNNFSTVDSLPQKNNLCNLYIKILDGKISMAYHTISIILKKSTISQETIEVDAFHKTLQYDYKIMYGAPGYFTSLMLNSNCVLLSIENVLLEIHADGSYTEKKFPGRILHLYQDADGDVWITVYEKGVFFYRKGNLDSPPIISLSNESISSMMVDQEGGIWATSFVKGVYYCASKKVIAFNNIDGLENNIISLCKLNKHVLCSNASSRFFFVDDTSSIELNEILLDKKVYYYSTKKIGNTIFFLGGIVLSADTGLLHFELIKYKGKSTSDFLYDITQTSQGEIVGINSGELVRVGNMEEVIEFLPARGRCIFTRHNGDVLIGTTEGIYQYKNEKIISPSNQTSLPQGKINKIIEDASNNLIVATDEKGIFIHLNNGMAKIISSKNGLPSDKCNAVVVLENILWVGTNKGLSKIIPSDADYSSVQIENYNTSHGLISNEIMNLEFDGEKLWLATANGLCHMPFSTLQPNKVPPPVYISHIFLHDSILQNHITTFMHDENNLRFILEALTYKSADKTYSYRLLGADSTWHTTLSNEINFSNLASGQYTLQAKAYNNDGIASTIPVSFSFVVLNPFWQTWWFISLEIIILIGCGYLYIYYRMKKIKKQEVEKTSINKQLAEYQMVALRAQMNPHFVFNAINSIQSYILNNDSQFAYDYLAKFSKLIRQVLSNSQHSSISLEKELEALKLYIELEQTRFKERFDFEILVDDNLPIEEIKVPTLLIQPYLENAIWHGIMHLNESKKGKLKVHLFLNVSVLKIIIEDNGIGRERSTLLKKESTHESFGMMLSEKRVDILKAINVKADIRIIDLYNDNKFSVGTRVEIDLPTYN